ncbi:MAG: hypothetical protein RLZZ546_197 [Bacteroidota bacterium]|jgi:ligand-binding sensor domain-containing protein
MKPLERLFILNILMFFNLLSLNAQANRVYYNFSKIDNFSEINVRAFAQDKDGFIYAATGSGLYVHQGNYWKRLKSPIDTTNHSIGTYLNFIKYDSTKNEIYLFSLNDFQIFNANTYTFKRVLCDEKFYKSRKFDCIFNQKLGSIIATDVGLIQLNADNKAIAFKPSEKWNLDYTTSTQLVYLNEKTFGVVNAEKFFIYDILNDSYTEYKPPVHIHFRKGILDKRNNRIYFQAIQALWYFDLNDLKYHKLPNSEHLFECRDILLSHDDKIWISSGYFFDLKNNTWTYIKYQEGKYNNAIQYWPSLFKDRENNIWCGSLGYGSNVQFNGSQSVSNVLYSKDHIFEPLSHIIHEGKIYLVNGIDGKISSINLENLNQESFGTTNKNGLVDITKNVKHKRYFCTDFIHIYEANLSKKKIDKITPLVNKIKNGIFFLETVDSLLVFGDQNKIYTYNFFNQNIKETNFPFEELGLFHGCSIDPNSLIVYFTGNKSTMMFDLRKNKGISPQESPLLRLLQKIPSAYQTTIKDHNLWITSLTNGLYFCDTKKLSLKNYTKEKNFLTSNFLNKIVILNDVIYAGTIESLNVFDIKKEKVIQKFDRQSGFKRDDTTYDLYADEKYIIKFNYGSIDILHKNKDFKISKNTNVYFNEINIDHHPKLLRPTHKDTSFVISELEANIEIEYGINVFDNFNNHSFEYRLLGKDTAWVKTFDRKINFYNLLPGEYTFEVKSTLYNGQNVPITRKLHLTIKPLFYKTAWFIILSLMTISGILYLFYRTKLETVRNEMRLKNKYEKQISELEMKALRAQMNPHFIFNSLNSIQRFIFEKDEYTASQYLTKFSRLIRLILDHSNQDVISISNEIEMLKYYIDMELLRFNHKFTYELSKDNQIDEETMIPSMVVQPHIENAIWHGLMHKEGECTLLIHFQYIDHTSIKIIIKDNGIGRKSAAELKSKQVLKKKSYGSKISEDRISNFNKLHNVKTNVTILDLEDENGKASGTQVELTIATLKN